MWHPMGEVDNWLEGTVSGFLVAGRVFLHVRDMKVRAHLTDNLFVCSGRGVSVN